VNRFILAVAAVVPVCSLVAAEEADRYAADEAAIRNAVEAYLAAFNRGDAKAVAANWAEDGEYVSPSGRRFKGRPAILAEFQAYFAESKGQRIEISNPAIRFLAPNVAVEEGTARVIRAGQQPTETRYLAIHVKQHGAWKLDSVRETVIPTPPSHHEYLRELEWLIGDWIDRDENSTIETKCQWTKNKNFLTRSFAVSIKDRVTIEGTQVIGWDPTAGAIRSWMFDSEGGFGEALWSRKGNRWIIKASRTLSGGEKASAVNILTYVDRNTFRWQSIGREIDGQLLPNIEEVTVVRKQSNR